MKRITQLIREASKALLATIIVGGITLVATGYFALTSALGAGAKPGPPAPPAPLITAGPASGAVMSSVTASFAYSDSTSGADFQCSLDGAKFSGCSRTGITYSGLKEGSHTFQVSAQAGGSSSSASASRGWTVDLSPPVLTVSFPASGKPYNNAGWAGCSPAGMCGIAADVAGTQSVLLSVQRSDGKYWTGTGFTSATESFNGATLGSASGGSTPWSYAFSLPADGSYVVHIRAFDKVGNSTPSPKQTALTFVADTLTPPAPTIVNPPSNPSFDTKGDIKFTDAEAGITFRCSIDGATASPCNGGTDQTYQLAIGDHCLAVQGVDPAGNTSPASSACWTIVDTKTIAIAANLRQPFTPGDSQHVDLSFTNPYNYDVKIVSVSVAVDAATTQTTTGQSNPSCNGQQNLLVVSPFSSSPASVVVPKNSTRSLSALRVPQAQWPLVQMPNLSTNQDGCQNTSFHVNYTGSAVKA